MNILLLALITYVTAAPNFGISSYTRYDPLVHEQPPDFGEAETNENFYIGLQNLMCVMGGGGKYSTSVNPNLFQYSPYHSIIKYKNIIFEWGFDGFYFGINPRSNCEVSWEPTLLQSIFRNDVIGESNHTIANAVAFGKSYEFIKGDYDFLLNNCHMFTNTLSSFLSSNVDLINDSAIEEVVEEPTQSTTMIPPSSTFSLSRRVQELINERQNLRAGQMRDRYSKP